MVDYVNRKAAQRHAQSLTMTYDEFIQKHLRSEEELQKQRNHVFDYMPKISIVVPLYCTDPVYLTALVDSVKAQTYSNWELCLSDGSGEPSPIAGICGERGGGNLSRLRGKSAAADRNQQRASLHVRGSLYRKITIVPVCK